MNNDITYEPIMLPKRGFYTTFHIGDIKTKYYNVFSQLKAEIARSLDPNINVDGIPITFYINSVGGDIDFAVEIADMIIKSPIKTIAYGAYIMSAATCIFVACDERYVYRDRYIFMIHGIEMNVSRIEDRFSYETESVNDILTVTSELMRYYVHHMIDIFKSRTSISVVHLTAVLYGPSGKKDYFDDDDMISCGIVTAILD